MVKRNSIKKSPYIPLFQSGTFSTVHIFAFTNTFHYSHALSPLWKRGARGDFLINEETDKLDRRKKFET